MHPDIPASVADDQVSATGANLASAPGDMPDDFQPEPAPQIDPRRIRIPRHVVTLTRGHFKRAQDGRGDQVVDELGTQYLVPGKIGDEYKVWVEGDYKDPEVEVGEADSKTDAEPEVPKGMPKLQSLTRAELIRLLEDPDHPFNSRIPILDNSGGAQGTAAEFQPSDPDEGMTDLRELTVD